jgi:hypothetical protein
MNWHVVAYYRNLCRMAADRREYLAQWLWYTQAELEADPNWKAPHI